MRSRSSGHFALGGASAGLGVVGLALGLLKPAWLSSTLAGTPFWALFVTGGFVLLLVGGCIVLFTARGAVHPEPPVPAHVAFAQKMSVRDIEPPTPLPRPAAAISDGRLPPPPTGGHGRVPARSDDLVHIDTKIRELTRQINKAGVMLATGQLSQQGYLAYVEDLKRQRGTLEAQRVRAELAS